MHTACGWAPEDLLRVAEDVLRGPGAERRDGRRKSHNRGRERVKDASSRGPIILARRLPLSGAYFLNRQRLLQSTVRCEKKMLLSAMLNSELWERTSENIESPMLLMLFRLLL